LGEATKASAADRRIQSDEVGTEIFTPPSTPILMLKSFVIALAVLGLGVPSGRGNPSVKTAIFAGGCFWCMQPEFDRTRGVIKTTVGYTGGKASDANYAAVSSHKTEHREAIEVTYEPAQVSYEKLLAIYWSNIDPTQGDGQFADVGLSYQAAIYYGNDEEKRIAEASKEALGKSGQYEKPIVTQILPAMKFYPAEEYHQKYYLKNASDYEAYHMGSGREAYQENMAAKKQKRKASSPSASPSP
jgi:methionine-S-sulfoxide reductase